MGITISETKAAHLDSNSDEIILLPVSFRKEDNYQYQSTSLSFYKYVRQRIKVSFFTEPKILREQRSIEWVGPGILITSSLVSHNPEIISITCGVISSYLADFFKGQEKPEVSIKILYKETETEKITEIEYKGCSNNLSQLRDAILEVVKK